MSRNASNFPDMGSILVNAALPYLPWVALVLAVAVVWLAVTGLLRRFIRSLR